MTHTPESYHTEREDTHTPQQDAISEQVRLSQLSMEISIALTREDTLQGMLTSCTKALVHHLDAAFARIWTLNEKTNILELQASSGMYTHLNGAHARVPVGAFKIGLIASERQPHLTNEVIGDPRVGEQEWARREGMVSFAGYPLLIEERLVGVVALFARYPLNSAILQAMATIANGITLGIERQRMAEERNRLLMREQAARIEAELTQERLTLAQRAGRIGTFEWNIQHNHILWTPELEALYGLAPGGFEGKYENWAQRVHLDDLPLAEANISDAIAGGPAYNIEFRVLWPDGTTRWLLAKGEISYDEQARPQRMIGVNIDITERKDAEQQLALMYENLQDLNTTLEVKVEQRTEVLHQLNTELQRSNQELQDFAYVASHDLQEPLRKIQAFGNLLEEEYGDVLGDGKAYLERMRNAATRMRILIDDLLTFSRVTTKGAPFSQIDLNAIVQQTIDDVEPRLQATYGRIEVQPLPTIEADAGQMHQVFQNLIVNALKFHRPDVPPIVRVFAEVSHPVETSSSSTETLPEQTQPYVLLFVEDNGIGFDEKYLDRIFTVFQRLHGKSDYEGTGIGLAVVRKIIERHGGSITARSSIGKGATFIISLPIAQSKMKETTI